MTTHKAIILMCAVLIIIAAFTFGVPFFRNSFDSETPSVNNSITEDMSAVPVVEASPAAVASPYVTESNKQTDSSVEEAQVNGESTISTQPLFTKPPVSNEQENPNISIVQPSGTDDGSNTSSFVQDEPPINELMRDTD